MPTVADGFTDFSGVSVNGIPLLGQPGSQSVRTPVPNGRVLWVNSNGGQFGAGDGTNINAPLATIGGPTGALARLSNRQNKGDIIYVLPGHTESVSAPDYFSDTGTASGFSIIGYGSGTLRPVLNWTTATSTWLVDTVGIEIANMQLNLCGSAAAGALTVATPITVSAASCRFVGNYINWGQDTDTGCGSTLGAIALVAATDCEFIGNVFENKDTAGTLAVSCISANGADRLKIVGNQIFGGTTSTTGGAVNFVTTASLNVQLLGNFIENTRASSTKAVTSGIAGVTGLVEGNKLRVNSGILGFTVSSNLSCTFANNYTNNTVNKNGALDVAGGTSV